MCGKHLVLEQCLWHVTCCPETFVPPLRGCVLKVTGVVP